MRRPLHPLALEGATYHEPFVGGGALFFDLFGGGEARPFIKCLGGKRQLLPELRRRLPPGRLKRAVLSDRNPDVAAAYEAVRDHPDALIAMLRKLGRSFNRAEYLWVREACDPGGGASFGALAKGAVDALVDSGVPEPVYPRAVLVARAARFVYLNKTAFNGLIRYNTRGKFNAPWGQYERPLVCDEPAIRAASRALQDADVHCCDFEEVSPLPGDVVYLDPPYTPTSKTSSFVSYTSEGFGPDDQERLARYVDRLASQGVRVIYSQSDSIWVRERMRSLHLHEVSARRSANSVASRRGAVVELIGTSYEVRP